ncbi:FAD/NAD-P-binding domain-containing protein [Gloeopeniophorella convolvens]|nr:FAD/NAD-P-binding domain-containing protein [Gloeopeniophorella convolvens]
MAAPSDAPPYDCIVVGSGHAGSCAALSAAEHGAVRVLLLDKCPAAWAGGNGFFTAGAHRTAHAGLQDLLPLLAEAPARDLAARIDVEPYAPAQFAADIARVCGGQSEPELVRALVDGSRDAVGWLRARAQVPFVLSFNRQAYDVGGRVRFWGGMALATRGGGKGLMDAHFAALARAGVEVRFEARVCELIMEGGEVAGVVVEGADGVRDAVRAHAVVLCAGGFEASEEMRREHLGAEWAHALVRGTPYNTGDGFAIARAAGARLAGDWGGCHATCWDAHASPAAGNQALSNQLTKSGYPLGLLLNTAGARFVDEGADLRNFTYAVYGAAVLRQPRARAFQVFDARGAGWLRAEEYGDGVVEKVHAESIAALAQKLVPHGLEDPAAFVRTVEAYNAAARAFAATHPERAWDPAAKDGRGTLGLALPKSNWALPLEEAPLLAVAVACGITFTFGGLAVDARTAGVLGDASGAPIPGLYCAGEMLGGLWYGNYPGGSGLTAGAVFGRIAGKEAAKRAKEKSVGMAT